MYSRHDGGRLTRWTLPQWDANRQRADTEGYKLPQFRNQGVPIYGHVKPPNPQAGVSCVLFMKVLELRVKNRALRAKNCELVEDNRRLSAESSQHDWMMRRLISAAERVLPDRESSAPAYENLRDAVNTARSSLAVGPRSIGGAPDA
jgi:hypothetical protein